MSKNGTGKRKLSKLENTRKTFKIFALSFHGTNLEVIGKELVRQMEVRSSKKIYPVMVNGTKKNTDEDQTISEATATEFEVEQQQTYQIEEGIERCKKDFELVWVSLTSTLSEDLRRYWSEDKDENIEESVKTDDDGDKSEEILPKKIKISDLQILNSEIKDFQTCDYFIVLIGKFSTEVLIKLLLSHQPLQAIIHFIPCPESDLEVNFPKLHEDIDFLRKSPDTMNVGIFIENLNQLPIPKNATSTTSEYIQDSEQEVQKYSQQIYDQFTWYLYDIEMLKQQFIVYQTDFVEINDTELPSQEELLWSKFVQVKFHSNKDTNDAAATDDDDADDGTGSPAAAVGVFLDNLFTAIENHANLERKKNSSSFCCYLSPFLENDYSKIIVEEANELLHSAVDNQLNLVTYWKLVNMVTRSGSNSDCEKCNTEYGIDLPKFYELMSWESFVQRLEARKIVYDECCQIDVSIECKLFVLRRFFDRVVKVTEKFHLPTRLCFRDFCSHIAPNLADFLRSFESGATTSVHPKFSGLIFNECLQELIVSKNIFRFKDGFISCVMENWSNEEQKISINMFLFANSVYFYPQKNGATSKLRFVAKNNLSCDIELYQQDQLYPNIFIQWPNGCQVRYINVDNLAAVEQCYHSKSQHSELKRLYTMEGFVICYLRNETIKVLTPNGIIYNLYIIETISYADLYFENSSQHEIPNEISDHIDFVRNLEKYGIYCSNCDVTLADGRKLRFSLNGTFQNEVDQFMIYEWTDYFENKKFLDRDDGVKMIWTSDCLKCYYPCGTSITTKVIEDCIRTNFECETNLMENIFKNPNPTFVAKGANKAKMQDSYVTYNLNYLMQHKNYATVEVCGKDKVEIHSPNGFKLILKEDRIQSDDLDTTASTDDDATDVTQSTVVVLVIDIGEELSFRIASGVCIIHSGVSVPEKKKIDLKLNLFPDVTDNFLTFQNKNASINLNAKGEMILSGIDAEPSPYEETSYLLSKDNSFGIEFISKRNYDALISKYKSHKYIYNNRTQFVLLKTILPIDETFLMLNASETSTKDLKHFQPVVCHQHKCHQTQDRVFTARVINKLNHSLKPLALIKKIDFNETTLENQLNAALHNFFGEKPKAENPLWKIKIMKLKEDLVYRKQRTRFYNTLLKYKIFPKYYEFESLNNDVKLLENNILENLEQ
ncbi:uncharacterized protein LOC129940662 [Eupeodes corollae]|uniref:uncharacterized protein LOC129940662 n=1 Tax=Eupeodes corollae TaxID=290404 RepID=UPI002493950D|nr:uncharacterized protein LOC129940662 [Eupeodes corollae]